MTNTPTLSQMGIHNPQEISRYTLRQVSRKMDVLKVHYHRQAGSLLPTSRTYRFGRSLKTSVGDSGQPRFDDTYEISPSLLQAQTELDALLQQQASPPTTRDALLHELNELRHQITNGQMDDPQEIARQLGILSQKLDNLEQA